MRNTMRLNAVPYTTLSLKYVLDRGAAPRAVKKSKKTFARNPSCAWDARLPRRHVLEGVPHRGRTPESAPRPVGRGACHTADWLSATWACTWTVSKPTPRLGTGKPGGQDLVSYE